MVVAKGPEAVDFFDDDDAERPPRRGGRPGGSGGSSMGAHPPANRQQMRARQAALAVGAIVMLILIVIAFRGCLDARKDRAFQNYVNDLSAITSETTQLSDQFFGRLGVGDSGNGNAQLDDLSFQQEVDGDRGTTQGLLDRAEGLDAPGEVAGAQQQIELSYELRHDALEGISAQLGKLSGSEAKQAADMIYTQMKVLSASDILFARASDQIEQALLDQEVAVEEVPQSQFLPSAKDGNFLDAGVTKSAFAGVAAGGSGDALTGAAGADCVNPDGGLHGLSIDPAAAVTVVGDGEITVDVLNGGETDESDITVTVTGAGGITGTGKIDTIASQEVQSAPVTLDPAPAAGETVDLDVSVSAVCGETLKSNNKATYSVTF